MSKSPVGGSHDLAVRTQNMTVLPASLSKSFWASWSRPLNHSMTVVLSHRSNTIGSSFLNRVHCSLFITGSGSGIRIASAKTRTSASCSSILLERRMKVDRMSGAPTRHLRNPGTAINPYCDVPTSVIKWCLRIHRVGRRRTSHPQIAHRSLSRIRPVQRGQGVPVPVGSFPMSSCRTGIPGSSIRSRSLSMTAEAVRFICILSAHCSVTLTASLTFCCRPEPDSDPGLLGVQALIPVGSAPSPNPRDPDRILLPVCYRQGRNGERLEAGMSEDEPLMGTRPSSIFS